MDSQASASRVQQMKNKIMGEAREKVAAIERENVELFNVEKEKLLHARKAKVSEEYSKKTKAVVTNYAIQKSLAINASRLEKIHKRQEMMERVKNDVRGKLQGKEAQDKTFITRLITQGLLVFLEDNVKVQCRAADMELVKSCLPDAAALYSKTVKDASKATKTCQLTLDAGQLPADSLGGVVLTCQNGTIVIDNTIDARLGLVMEQDKPAIRAALFGGVLPPAAAKKPEPKSAEPKRAAAKPAQAPAEAPAKILTIKNLAAVNLKNSDLLGSSDSYVRLSVVHMQTHQRIGKAQKTAVKDNGGANPKWDGAFSFTNLRNIDQLALKLKVLDSDSFLALDGELADELNDDDELGAGRVPLKNLKACGSQDLTLEIAPGYFSNSSLKLTLTLS